MKILILGLGVIGSTYGYILRKSGHDVAHYIRPTSQNHATESLSVSLLDGRNDKKGLQTEDHYPITRATPGSRYDFIIVSLSSLRLEEALETLRDNRFEGTILLFCGVWESREHIERIMAGRPYLLGYPVAGGRLNKADCRLECVVFGHIMLESRERTAVENYDDITRSFLQSGIKSECPHDMLEWIWLHMSINAGVISTIIALAEADPKRADECVERLMDSTHLLRRAVLTVRECMKIVAGRGVNLRHYRGEVLPFRLPVWLSAPLMKRMFATQILTRQIMLLHANVPDLLHVCRLVYCEGKTQSAACPLFNDNVERYMQP